MAHRSNSSRHLLFGYYIMRGLSLLYLPYTLENGAGGLGLFAVFYGLDWIATVPPTVRLTGEAFGRENTGVVYGWNWGKPSTRRIARRIWGRRHPHRGRRLPPRLLDRRSALRVGRSVLSHDRPTLVPVESLRGGPGGGVRLRQRRWRHQL